MLVSHLGKKTENSRRTGSEKEGMYFKVMSWLGCFWLLETSKGFDDKKDSRLAWGRSQISYWEGHGLRRILIWVIST